MFAMLYHHGECDYIRTAGAYNKACMPTPRHHRPPIKIRMAHGVAMQCHIALTGEQAFEESATKARNVRSGQKASALGVQTDNQSRKG